MADRSIIELARHEGYCPVCGYQTLDEGPTGSWAICPICYWEDEPYPLNEPDTITGGPNENLSLTKARKNAQRYGDIYEGGSASTRPPRPDETRHPDWPFQSEQ